MLNAFIGLGHRGGVEDLGAAEVRDCKFGLEDGDFRRCVVSLMDVAKE